MRKVNSLSSSAPASSARTLQEIATDIQDLLRDLGVSDVPETGKFDFATKTQLETFAFENGLSLPFNPASQQTVEMLQKLKSERTAVPTTAPGNTSGLPQHTSPSNPSAAPQKGPAKGSSNVVPRALFKDALYKSVPTREKDESSSDASVSLKRKHSPERSSAAKAEKDSDEDELEALYQSKQKQSASSSSNASEGLAPPPSAKSARTQREEGKVDSDSMGARRNVANTTVGRVLTKNPGTHFPGAISSSQKTNNDCSVAAAKTVLKCAGKDPQMLDTKNILESGGKSEVVRYELLHSGFEPIGFSDLKKKVDAGEKFFAWVNGPSLDGVAQHAYCITAHPSDKTKVLAWDPDSEEGGVRELTLNKDFFDSIFLAPSGKSYSIF